MRNLPSSSWPPVRLDVAPGAVVANSYFHLDLGHRAAGLLGLTVTGYGAQENVGSMSQHSWTGVGAGGALRTDLEKVGPQELSGPNRCFLSL